MHVKNAFSSEHSETNDGKGTTRNAFKGRLDTLNKCLDLNWLEVQNPRSLMLELKRIISTHLGSRVLKSYL